MRHQRGLGANDALADYDDGRLRVRPADYIATADGTVLRLKLRELGLLARLANDRNRVITREELLETVWDDEPLITSRAVDAAIARLRATLSAALPDVRYIHTHARVGYRFCPEPASAYEGELAAGTDGNAVATTSASSDSSATGPSGPIGSASKR
jgi:DNA-binding response OmpR family regulator